MLQNSRIYNFIYDILGIHFQDIFNDREERFTTMKRIALEVVPFKAFEWESYFFTGNLYRELICTADWTMQSDALEQFYVGDIENLF